MTPRSSVEALLAGLPELAAKRSEAAPFRMSNRYLGPAALMLERIEADSGPGRHVLDYADYLARIVSRESPSFDLLNLKYLLAVQATSVRSRQPNLVAQQYVTLQGTDSAWLPVRPALESTGLEVVVATHVTERLERGRVVGTVELQSAEGGTLAFPLRFGIELDDIAEGGVVERGVAVRTPFFIDVTDAQTLSRQHYLVRLDFAPTRVVGVRLHNGSQASELLVKGLAYKEVAAELGISYSTVHRHIESIYRKLHVHSRSHAVAKYLGG